MRISTFATLLCLTATSACTTASSNMAAAVSPAQLPGYRQSYDAVFSAAVDAVSMLSWELTVAQKDVGVISAKTPMSLATWGDKVTIRIFRPDSARGDSLVRVGFTSGTDQAIDWGKNGRNQRAFFEKLNGSLAARPPDE
jgi:hypothetical protein